MNRAIDLSTLAGVIIMFTVLIAVGLYSRDNLDKVAQSRALVERTHETLKVLSETLLAVEDAETGQRGFVITGDERYLEPYNKAVERVDGLIWQVRQVAGKGPEDSLVIDELTRAVTEKLQRLKETIVQRRHSGFNAAQNRVVAREGRQLMDVIRKDIGLMTAQQYDDLKARSDQLDDRSRKASVDLLTFAGLAIAFQIVMTVITRNFLKARKLAESKLLAVLESVADGLVQVDRDETIVYINPAAETLLQLKREEVIGQKFQNVVELSRIEPTETVIDQQSSRELPTHAIHNLNVRQPSGEFITLSQVLRDRAVIKGIERRLRVKDVVGFVARISVAPVVNDTGDIGAVISIQDISASKLRQSRIDLQHAIARILTYSDSQEDSTRRILRTIGQILDIDVGTYWRFEPATASLLCKDVWIKETGRYAEFQAMCLETRFRQGEGLPGEVIQMGEPFWLSDLLIEETMPRLKSGIKRGLRSGFAFPIASLGRKYGVFEFFSEQPRSIDLELVATMNTVAAQIGHFFDRKRVEEEMLANERKFHAVFDSTFEFMGILTTDGTLVEANETALTFAGVDLKDVVGKPFWETPWWSHSKELQETLKNAISEASTGKLVRFEAWHKNLLQTVQVDFSLKPVFSEDGEVVMLIPEGHDITERIRSQRVLAEKEARTKAIVDTAPDGIITLAGEGIIESANEAAHKIFNYQSGELVGQNVAVILPGFFEDGNKTRSADMTTGERRLFGVGIELQGVLKDGTPIPVELNMSVLDLGEQQIITGIVRDISERKVVERRVSEFYSTVSHELRTPLTSIRGSLGLLEAGRAGDFSARAKQLIVIAREESDRLIRLINDILDIRKVQAGKLELRFETNSPEELVARSLAAVHGMAQAQNVTIKTEVLSQEILWADQDRIVQVLANLLSNAIKFSVDRTSVVIRAESPSPGWCRFSVIDKGAGIDERDMPKLFGYFQQLDSSDSRAKGGTGLGLAISKAIVEQHGGKIGAISALQEGSTFWFELPTVTRKKQRLQNNRSSSESLMARAKDALIVDQDDACCDLIQECLDRARLQSDRTTSLKHARMYLEKHSLPPFIFVNLGLPDGSALDLLEMIEAMPGRTDTSVILTAVDPSGKRLYSKPLLIERLGKHTSEERLAAVTRTLTAFTKDAMKGNALVLVEDKKQFYDLLDGDLRANAQEVVCEAGECDGDDDFTGSGTGRSFTQEEMQPVIVYTAVSEKGEQQHQQLLEVIKSQLVKRLGDSESFMDSTAAIIELLERYDPQLLQTER